MPGTLEAIVLLGSMEQDQAKDLLLNSCVFDPAIDEAQALRIWTDYKQRVDALGDRPVTVPRRLNLTPAERDWERRFLIFTRQLGVNVRSLIKVNLMELVVHQTVVLTGRSADYNGRIRDSAAWNREALPIQLDQHQCQVNIQNNGTSLALDMDVPHSEWLVVPVNCKGEIHLRVAPALRHVTVTQPEPDRLLLWAGYHRSHAWVNRARPEGTDCPALVALVENVVRPPIAGNTTLFDRMVRGPRPAFFGDFFDDRLFMRVALRKKRFQMQIRSAVVAIDEP